MPVIPRPDRHRPQALDAALSLMSARRPRVIAGGTDVYPAAADQPLQVETLDLSGIVDLGGVQLADGVWRIGAGATWADLGRTLPGPAFDGLKAAAREIGSVQIQNMGTLVGNLCNASPAADGAPCLLALDAEIELASVRGVRRLPLSEFLLGPRRTALAADELATAILVPQPDEGAQGAFLKLGARAYLVISIAMVSAVLTPNAAGRVARARVAVGACSAVAQRLPALEAALEGLPLDGRALAAAVDPAQFTPLAPIDDLRATAAYRREAAVELTRRTLAGLGREAAAA